SVSKHIVETEPIDGKTSNGRRISNRGFIIVGASRVASVTPREDGIGLLATRRFLPLQLTGKRDAPTALAHQAGDFAAREQWRRRKHLVEPVAISQSIMPVNVADWTIVRSGQRILRGHIEPTGL